MIGGQFALRIVSLATTVVLARLLTPREIGLATEALVFSQFTFLLTDVGVFAVLVQRPRLSDEDRQTAFWTSVVLGVVLALGLFGLAGPIAHLYGEPKVEPLLQVLSLSVLFMALGLTPGSLLIRDLRFRSIQVRTVVGTLAASAAAISIAALGYGAWAIVAQTLAITGATTILTWLLMNWRPRLVYSFKSLRSFAGFSGYVFGTDLLQYLSRNTDNLLIGRFIGAAKLGAYSLAYSVMLVPLRTLANPVQEVIFPAMSRIGEAKRVGQIWVRTSRLIAAVAVPVYLGLLIVAPDFVNVIFGSKWKDAVPVLQILAYVGLVQSWGGMRGSVLLALDKASTLFRLQLMGSSMAIASFIIGLHWGIVGVAAVYAVSTTIVAAVGTVVTGRIAHVGFLEFLGRMSGVLLAGALMTLSVLAAQLLLIDTEIAQAGRLAILVAVGAAVYIPACAWRAPEVPSELRDSWRVLRGRGEPGPAPAA
jgi:polysaccharide transporter, PST family